MAAHHPQSDHEFSLHHSSILGSLASTFQFSCWNMTPSAWSSSPPVHAAFVSLPFPSCTFQALAVPAQLPPYAW